MEKEYLKCWEKIRLDRTLRNIKSLVMKNWRNIKGMSKNVERKLNYTLRNTKT